MLSKRLNKTYLRHRMLTELERLQSLGGKTGLYLTADQKALLSLKDRYKGRSCVIIGNGPSLTMEDLTAIHEAGLVTVASNRIYLAFDKTPWRPDIYTAADQLVIEQNALEMQTLGMTKIIPSRFQGFFGGSPDKHPGCSSAGDIIFFRSRGNKQRNPAHYVPKIPDNAMDGFFVGQTVTVLNIQVAYWLGCTSLYLIGLDGKYSVPDKSAEHSSYGAVAVSSGEENHFSKDYRKKGESWSIPRPDLHEIEYRACRTFMESRNIQLVNASRVSYVKAFEKCSLDEVLKAG